jgi:predicted ATP-grasp superfamily ATP-dependent carboligase
MKILLTDSDYKHTLGIVRSLGRLGHTIDLVGNKISLSGFSKYSNSISYSQDKFNEENILDFFEFLSKSKYDLIIPIGAKSVELISKYRIQISRFTNVFVPDFNTIETCLNKDKTYFFLGDKDINLPTTWSFSDLDQLKASLSEIRFPVVLKSKNEINKTEAIYIYDSVQLLRSASSFYISHSDFPLIQEYIEGEAYGFFAFYLNGKCQSYFMHRRVREYPASGGSSTCAESIFDDELFDQGSRILNLLNWHGIAMVEFKKSKKDNKFYLIEVNPKFWGSHDLAIASGVNFPLELINYISNNKYKNDNTFYKIGLRFQWPFEGELFHFADRPKSFLNILGDLLDFKVKSNILIQDIRPNLYSIKCNLNFKNLAHIFFKNSEFLKIYYRSKIFGIKSAIYRSFSEVTGIQLMAYTSINENILIGCQHSRIGKFFLKLNGVNCSVNLRDEYDDCLHSLNFLNNLYFPIVEHTTPSTDDLKIICQFINDSVNRQDKIFIHCSEGVSRAATVVVAYFIFNGESLENSISKVKQIRPFINILESQMLTLRSFSEQIKDCSN